MRNCLSSCRRKRAPHPHRTQHKRPPVESDGRSLRSSCHALPAVMAITQIALYCALAQFLHRGTVCRCYSHRRHCSSRHKVQDRSDGHLSFGSSSHFKVLKRIAMTCRPELSRHFVLRNHLSQVHGRPLPGHHDRQGQRQVCCSVVRGDGAKSGIGCLGFKGFSLKVQRIREFAQRTVQQNCKLTPVLKSRDAPIFDDVRAPVC